MGSASPLAASLPLPVTPVALSQSDAPHGRLAWQRSCCQRWPRARLQGCCEASKPSTSHLWAGRRSWHLGARPGVAGGTTLAPATTLPPQGRLGAPSQRPCHLLGCGLVAAAGSQGREPLLSARLAGQLRLCLFVPLWPSSFPIKAGESLPNQLGNSRAGRSRVWVAAADVPVDRGVAGRGRFPRRRDGCHLFTSHFLGRHQSLP